MSKHSVVKTFDSIDEAVAVLGSAIDLDSTDMEEATVKGLLDRRLLWLETVNLSHNGRGVGIVGYTDDFYPPDLADDEKLIASLSRSGIEYLSSFGPTYQDTNNGLYILPQRKRPVQLHTLICLEADKNDFLSIASDILHPGLHNFPQARELILKALPLVEIIPYSPEPNQTLAFYYTAIKSLLR